MEMDKEIYMDESLNKTFEEIDKMYDTLRYAIRNYISRLLEAHNATEDNPLQCDVSLDFNACGISSALLPSIDSIYQDNDGSGMIWCCEDGQDEPMDFDELTTDDQMCVLKYLDYDYTV